MNINRLRQEAFARELAEREESDMEGTRIDPHEMLRLRDMLDVAGVAYERDDGYLGADSWQTKTADFETDGTVCSAGFSCVLHQYSYGGVDGLLELWAAGMEEPCGFLGADNVMDTLGERGLA